MKPVPWYAWYPLDYLTDTVHLTLSEDGAYRRLLDWQWLHDQPIPKGLPALSEILRVPITEARALWPKLKRYFPRGRSPRLEKERQTAKTRIEQGRKAAKYRWSKSLTNAGAMLEHSSFDSIEIENKKETRSKHALSSQFLSKSQSQGRKGASPPAPVGELFTRTLDRMRQDQADVDRTLRERGR